MNWIQYSRPDTPPQVDIETNSPISSASREGPSSTNLYIMYSNAWININIPPSS